MQGGLFWCLWAMDVWGQKGRQPGSAGCAGVLPLREVVGLEQQRWPRRREVTQQEDAMMGHRGEREPEESRTILNSGARAWLAGGATNQAEEIQGRKRFRREEKEFS